MQVSANLVPPNVVSKYLGLPFRFLVHGPDFELTVAANGSHMKSLITRPNTTIIRTLRQAWRRELLTIFTVTFMCPCETTHGDIELASPYTRVCARR